VGYCLNPHQQLRGPRQSPPAVRSKLACPAPSDDGRHKLTTQSIRIVATNSTPQRRFFFLFILDSSRASVQGMRRE